MEIGGGFGGKLTSYLELPAALLARKCARPVKMTMSRSEVLRATGPTSASRTKVKVGVDDRGVITAARAEVVLESGMHPGSPLFQAMLMAFGPYWLENVEIEGWEVLVNKPHVHAYRAPGAPLTSFAVETLMNEIGDALGIDPLELRRRNAAVAGAWRADGTTLPVSGNVECLDAIEQSDHWKSPLGEPSGPGKARGRGFASGMWRNNTFESSLDLRLHADGSVTLTEGSVDIGGSRTAIALQLAEVLGVDVGTIQPVVVDTDSVGFNHSTGGSRTTNVTGQAAIMAGRNLVAEMSERLAELWAAEVEFCDGMFSGPDQRVEFAGAAALLAAAGQLPTATATVAPTVKAPSYAIHACDVEVDLETGKCDVLRWTVAQDAGRRDLSALRRGTDAGRGRPGRRLGPAGGVLVRRLGRDGQRFAARLPHADRAGLAPDRSHHRRGSKPGAPVRGAWGRRSPDRGGSRRRRSMRSRALPANASEICRFPPPRVVAALRQTG